MKTVLKTIFVTSLAFLSFSSFADPIQDNVFQAKEVDGFPSSATPCPVVCKQLKGSIAESESFFAPQLKNKYTAVCKAPTKISDRQVRAGFMATISVRLAEIDSAWFQRLRAKFKGSRNSIASACLNRGFPFVKSKWVTNFS